MSDLKPLRVLLWLCVLSCAIPSLQARVARVEVISRADVLAGRTFGSAGSYERLTGRVYFAVRADDPHNVRIVDLANAANLSKGEVTFSADFVAVRPKEAGNSNGSLILEIPNRGHGGIIRLVDAGDWDLSKDAGDAWLLGQGFTVVTLGWQWDATGEDALRLYAPVVKHGTRVTGLLRGDLMPFQPMPVIPLGHLINGSIGGSEYPVSDPADPRNVLTVRESRDLEPSVIPRSRWQFAKLVNGQPEPSDRFIYLQGGFQPGKLYEYVYVVRNPVIAGLSFAAVRDFASYAKHGPEAVIRAQRVYGLGISQDARFLRDFLYQGFNADESGQMALDGVLAHVAGAGRGSFNYRFAQPSRDAQPTSSVHFPTDIFPFTDLPEKDPLSAKTDGLLNRASAAHVVPKIFFSNTSYEYWGRVASLIHTSADGKSDVSISPEVRIYHFTGLQHFTGPFPPARGFAAAGAGQSPSDLLGRNPESPLPVRYFWRALIAAMDAWVRAGIAPPQSSYPKIADGTLVPLTDYRFPHLPGVPQPHEANQAWRLDFGPHWQEGILALQPPRIGKPFPVLVPQVDEDGNEVAGIRLPEVAVPLATYASWNLRDPSIGAPTERVAFEGSFLPFARNVKERNATGDPRKSIEERYSSREDYLARFETALDALVQRRWILSEDRSALLQRAALEWDSVMRP